MTDNAAIALNSDCHCWPVTREPIVKTIDDAVTDVDMASLLSERPHYFAATTGFLSPSILCAIKAQVRAIETVIALPAYEAAIRKRTSEALSPSAASDHPDTQSTKGVFMGYDFHITEDGPRLIEINSNAGGAFIVDKIEQAVQTSDGCFAKDVMAMFQSEWRLAGRTHPLKTIAIVDTDPTAQYHYPDMVLAKSLLEAQGLHVVIADPEDLGLQNGKLTFQGIVIDLVYNRLTDFDLSASENKIIRQAYDNHAAVITPAPHHHALYADKRNLILLSDKDKLSDLGVSGEDIDRLKAIPKTVSVSAEKADELWAARRQLFFKPQDGFGSRGAFRGAKLTKRVWADILKGGYIAQERIIPPLRAVTVNDEKTALKFDVRVYTYDAVPLLFAARIYQGQTTNLRTAGGGLAAVIPLKPPLNCAES